MLQHAQLIAQMRLRAHRPLGPGVELAAAELIERAKPTHEGIGALASDARATLLSADAPLEHAELAADYFAFVGEWIQFYRRLNNQEDIPHAAEEIDKFDRRYRDALLAYQGLGFRPSHQPPFSYRAAIAARAADIAPKPIPVLKLLAVSGGALALFFYFRKKRSSVDSLPSIRVGPPAPEEVKAVSAQQISGSLTEPSFPSHTLR